MNNIWTERYRPTILEQIKSQEHILIILNQLVKSDDMGNNILFYGRPGTGKTSCILSFAKTYYGDNYKNMILELNASDNRGVNMVRNTISDFVNTKLFFNNKKKIIILDEADSMTIDAQTLLIQLMEEHKQNVIFCFICNYINKISVAINSRCLCFRFNNIKFNDMTIILKNIAKNENINISDNSIFNSIYHLGNKDMRKCINIFQNLIEDNKIISNIYKVFNYPTNEHIKSIIDILLNNESNLSNSFLYINNIIEPNQLLLKNIVNEITLFINKNKTITNIDRYLYILIKLGDIELFLTNDYNFKIQLYSLIAIFKRKKYT